MKIAMIYPGIIMKIAIIYPGINMKIVMKYPRENYENRNDIHQGLGLWADALHGSTRLTL